LTAKISKNSNKTPQNLEYQSCRASIEEHFSQRPTYVLINRLSVNCRQRSGFLGAGEQELLALTTALHHFPLQISNATQHESCVPQKTGQLLYWENLKCLGEIWRTRQKF
jgi:hypothetical protein